MAIKTQHQVDRDARRLARYAEVLKNSIDDLEAEDRPYWKYIKKLCIEDMKIDIKNMQHEQNDITHAQQTH